MKTAQRNAVAFGKWYAPNGDELRESFEVYGVLLDAEGNPESMAVISFSSTKIKTYKQYNTRLNMFTIKGADGRKVRPPLFAHQIRLTTVKEKNPKGEFFVVDLQPANGSVASSLLPPGHPSLEAAKELMTMVTMGEAKAADDVIDVPVSKEAVDSAWNP